MLCPFVKGVTSPLLYAAISCCCNVRQLHSICYYRVHNPKGFDEINFHSIRMFPAGHFPTWESAVGGFGSAKDFRQLRKSISADPNTLRPPKPVGPRPKKIPPGQWDSYGQGHVLPFPGIYATKMLEM